MAADKVGAMRDAFDRSFAEPPRGRIEEVENLLAIRVAGHAYALRVAEVASLAADRKIVAVPSAAHGLLGVAGIRGVIVPVYGLAALLGLADTASPPRWLALCGAHKPVGLAFHHLDRYLSLPSDQRVADVVRTPGGLVPLIDIPSILAAISKEP
jgi:chemotaxis signal transduction protein